MSRRATSEKLKFKEQIVKGVSSGELIKRLQALHKELSSIDQDHVDTTSLDKVKKDLIAPSLLLGKDKGVKSYVACCLADLLRLYAPDAPYTGPELRDIFYFFLRQLKNLTGPNCPHYQEYFYLIESLSNVKSAVLICDVPDSEDLMTEAFKQFFDLARPDLPKNAMACLADIMSQLIEEAQQIPQDVVDCILAQFLPKNVRSNPAALALAVDVCEPSSETLQRYVAQYFSEVILSAMQQDEEEEEPSSDEGTSRKKRKKAQPRSVANSEDFRLAHDLIKQINRSCTSLLTNVIPQLEAELLAEDVGVRLLASQTLGDMFADKPAEKNGTIMAAAMGQTVRSDLARKFPTTWRTWLSRSKDKSAEVRLAVLQSFNDILVTHHELGRDVYQALRQKLTDPEEKVRIAACHAFSTIDHDSAMHSFDTTVLHYLAERILDRKVTVQKEAVFSLGRMYDHAYPAMASGNIEAIERFAWIPQALLRAPLTSDKELLFLVERAILEQVLPLPSRAEEESVWVDRLLFVFQHLDIVGQRALLRMARLYDRRPLLQEVYLDACQKYNGGTIDEDEEGVTKKLKNVCRALSVLYSEQTKAESDLMRFAKLNDARMYKLLRILIDPSSDLATIIKTKTEAFNRLEKASNTIQDTFKTFVRRTCLWIINRSSIPQLFKRIQKASELPDDAEVDDMDEDTQESGAGEEEAVAGRQKIQDRARLRSLAVTSGMLLEQISKSFPLLFKAHAGELAKSVLEENDETLVRLSLQALSSLISIDPDSIGRDRALLARAYDLALNGTPAQAKFAASLVAKTPDNHDQTVELVQDITDSLQASSGVRLVSHLNALKRIAKHNVKALDTKREDVTNFLLRDVLKKPADAVNGDMSHEEDVKPDLEETPDWVVDEDFAYADQACILALKILTYSCISHKDLPQADVMATGTFKLLWTILRMQGQPKTFRTGPGLAGRLRLQAAQSLLILGGHASYEKMALEHFELLAWVAQDSAYQVRQTFIQKLVKYIMKKKVTNTRYTLILFLTAHDPDRENILLAKQGVMELVKRTPQAERVKRFDMLLVRLLHLLAHHPDFNQEVEDLKMFVKYIELFLDCIATKENISLLLYLAMKMKIVRDPKSQGHSENLYVLSELAEYVIKMRAQLHSWVLSTHPGNIRMPGDIFKPLPSKEAAQDNRKMQWISQETLEALGVVGRPVKIDNAKKTKAVAAALSNSDETKKRKVSPKVKRDPLSSATKRARKAKNGASNGSAKKPKSGRKKAEWEGSDDEEDVKADDSETGSDDSLEEALQAYEDELDKEESGGENISPSTAAKKKRDQAGKDAEKVQTRPANLRQRPQKTEQTLTSAAAKARVNGAKRQASSDLSDADMDED